MKAKIICILVMTLLITTALPAVGTMNNKKDTTVKPLLNSAVFWTDNFDSYTLGQYLDGTPDDGGWIICDCDYNSDGAYVVDTQSLSNPHSLEIIGETDILHEFTRLCSGVWTFTTSVYVPDIFLDRGAIGFDSYHPFPWDGIALMRQLVVYFTGSTGRVSCSPSGPELPLITEQWVELRIEIDFEEDWLDCFYNDEFLIGKKWSYDHVPGYYGYRNLAAICVSYSTSEMDTPIYFDDFSIEGIPGPDHELYCEGNLRWEDVNPGEKVTGSFTVENIGEPTSRLEWMIEEIPDWGTWTFNPSNGSLTPEDGPLTIQVSVKAPDEKNTEFTGELKLRAICDPAENYSIPVYLKTPRSKAINNPFLNWLQSHPNLFPLLQKLLHHLGL